MIPDGYTDLAPGKIASVVTFLEMRERPASNAVSAGEVESRPVELRRIKAPANDWYRKLFRRAGEQWLWFSRLEMTDDQLAAILRTTEVFVAEHAGAEIGMGELDRSHLPDVEITSFALFEEAIGKGLGRPFMAKMLEQAWSGDTKRVWLHTCNFDSPAALSFYMKCGFRPYKRAIEQSDDPRIRGVLPKDAASQIPIL